MFGDVIAFIRKTFNEPEAFIPLHAPHFSEKEKQYVLDTIDSTFVSSVGAYVQQFEEIMATITGTKFAVATVNGTSALHLALVAGGVREGDEVITQPLTFVATANAISHAGGTPVFLDVDRDTMGLSPTAVRNFLEKHATVTADGACINNTTGKRLAACVPMHTFGFPLRIDELIDVCDEYRIPVIEDAAESLGSYYKQKHTGSFGAMATFSFNGNKTVTCGGGGAIVTNDERIAKKLKHLSTTAKIQHPWEFVHDEVAFNYRLPNLNAALACAQLERLDEILANKNELADLYRQFFKNKSIEYAQPIAFAKPNNWLNTIILKNGEQKETFLQFTNEHKVMTRPIWRLMNKLPMYTSCQTDELVNSLWLEERVVNIPSSFRPKN